MSIYLESVQDKIRVVTSTVAHVDASASYIDAPSPVTGISYAPHNHIANITSATTTDLVSPPIASFVRNVQRISLLNIDTAVTAQVSIVLVNAAGSAHLWDGKLSPGDSVVIDEVGRITVTSAGVQTDYISIRQFGGVGDGVANESPAISAAFTYAAGTVGTHNAAYGGNVYFPRGEWRITQPMLPPNGVGVAGAGPSATMFIADPAFNFDYMISNALQAGNQEWMFIKDCQFNGNASAGALCNVAVVNIVSLFVTSKFENIAAIGGSNHGLRVATTNANGPLSFRDIWCLRNGGHGMFGEEVAGNTQANVGVRFVNLTCEHNGSNSSGVYLKGLGHTSEWLFENVHMENGTPAFNRTPIVIDGCSHVRFSNVQILGVAGSGLAGLGATGGAEGPCLISITNNASNVNIEIKNVYNPNLGTPVLIDSLRSITYANPTYHLPWYVTSDVAIRGGLRFVPDSGATAKSLVAQDSGLTDRAWFDKNARLTGSSVFGAGLDVKADATNNRALCFTDNAETRAWGWYFPDASNMRFRNFTGGVDMLNFDNSGNGTIYNKMNFQAAFLNPARLAPTALSANQNDYNPGVGNKRKLIISASGAVNVTGIAGGVDGAELFVYNSGTVNTITLTNDDAASTAANRIYCRGNANFALAARTGVVLMYDSTLARWLMQ